MTLTHTLKSLPDLAEYLLKERDFDYVLLERVTRIRSNEGLEPTDS